MLNEAHHEAGSHNKQQQTITHIHECCHYSDNQFVPNIERECFVVDGRVDGN